MRRLLRASVSAVWPVYFSHRQLPLFRWIDPRDAARLWRRGAFLAFRDWRKWAMVAVDLLAIGELISTEATIVKVVRFAVRRQPVPPHLSFGCHSLLCLVPVSFLAMFVCTQVRFRLIYSYVLAAHPHLCRRCGYDLTTTPARCPECGGVPAGRTVDP